MAHVSQRDGPWSIWQQALELPAAGWDGHPLFLGYSLVLKVWPKRSLLKISLIWTTADTSHGS